MNRSVPVATQRTDITEFLLLARGQQPSLLMDEKLRDFVGWWLRMHRHRNALRMVRLKACLLYTSPSPRHRTRSRMPSSA